MRLKRTLALVAAISCLVPTTTFANFNTGDGGPPIFIPGARVVDLRTTSGYLARYTTIPSASLFATTGGSGQSCSFVAGASGTASDGQHYSAGQTVYSDRWIFVETTLESFGEAAVINPQSSRGTINTAPRGFMVFCDSSDHLLQYLVVYPTDPMINPHLRLTTLYNGLLLQQPTVFRNPVVDKWGGLITRYPSWLAIGASAWRPQQSNPDSWRGWLLYLYTVPVALDFHVEFTPDPAQPSTPFDGIVACVGRGDPAVGDGAAFPAFPTLPNHTQPGVNWPCMWTPPGPGSVTITARITYRVTFWANGFTEQLADYVWSSAPATFPTGELSSVNTNG